jgi:hypothetical protein
MARMAEAYSGEILDGQIFHDIEAARERAGLSQPPESATSRSV